MCILYCSDVHRILIMIWYGVWQQCSHNPLKYINVCVCVCAQQAGDDQEFYLTIELSTDGYDVIMFAVLGYAPLVWVDLLMPIFLFVYCFCQFTFHSFACTSLFLIYAAAAAASVVVVVIFFSPDFFVFLYLFGFSSSRILIAIACIHTHVGTWRWSSLSLSSSSFYFWWSIVNETQSPHVAWCERETNMMVTWEWAFRVKMCVCVCVFV